MRTQHTQEACLEMNFEEKRFVLGVGAQKAGTTWLHDYLYQRGDVFLPRRKEMHYFDAKYRPSFYGRQKPNHLLDVDAGKDPESLKGSNAYKEFFRKRVPRDIEFFGEITPSYAAIGEPGFQEIRSLFPNLRVIFIMREPVDRFYSQVRMFRDKLAEKGKPPRDLEKLIDDPKFAERSTYEGTVTALDAVFRPEQIIYLFYETLFREESIRNLCEALGMHYQPADFQTVVNSGGKPSSIPSDIHERLLEKFQPTYAFCRSRFGADLPAQWLANDKSNDSVPNGALPDSSNIIGDRPTLGGGA
jgi:hypothetical protein